MIGQPIASRLLLTLATFSLLTLDAAAQGPSSLCLHEPPALKFFQGVVVDRDGEQVLKASRQRRDVFLRLDLIGRVKTGQRLMGCTSWTEEAFADPNAFFVIVPGGQSGARQISLYKRGEKRTLKDALAVCVPLLTLERYIAGGAYPDQVQVDSSFRRCVDVHTR